ncbi:M56 family metallopeptidase [Actinomadura macrotermitis]|uniref:Peptidase M48 domain-containing protein n=1 Tax=Actinomadura macrotermitis TaxID=2585200 RepID=A0A7K0BT42_9ACTN|nr:hypothetical protein [Actinomadura macrotermitis]
MNEYTCLPAVITLVLGVVLGWRALPLHPRWSARVLAITAAMAALAGVGTVVFIAVNYGATLAPGAADRLPEWMLFGDDRPVPPLLGVPAAALTGAAAVVVGRRAVRWTRELRRAQRAARSVLESDALIATAVPGRRGGVLVSRGLLNGLTARELEVVFRHEESHLRHRHHRYLAAGAFAAALIPPLRTLEGRLRLAVERWADEDAAAVVGDRVLIAHTIAKVALAGVPEGGPAPAFTDSIVVERVQAMLASPPGTNPVTGPVVLAGSGLTTGLLAATALQLDHALVSTFL